MHRSLVVSLSHERDIMRNKNRIKELKEDETKEIAFKTRSGVLKLKTSNVHRVSLMV